MLLWQHKQSDQHIIRNFYSTIYKEIVWEEAEKIVADCWCCPPTTPGHDRLRIAYGIWSVKAASIWRTFSKCTWDHFVFIKFPTIRRDSLQALTEVSLEPICLCVNNVSLSTTFPGRAREIHSTFEKLLLCISNQAPEALMWYTMWHVIQFSDKPCASRKIISIMLKYNKTRP